MRVSFFVNNYAPSRGGVQEHIARVAEGLVADHGMRVDILTSDALQSPGGPSPGQVPAGDEVVRGVHVHRRPVARRFHSGVRLSRRVARRLGLNLPTSTTVLTNGPIGVRLATTAYGLARRSDVVIGVTAPSASLWYATFLRRGSPLVAMPLIHLDQAVRPWVLRSVFSADAVVTNTGVERSWLLDQGVRPELVRVLPPGSDLPAPVSTADARRRLGLEERLTIGFIGRRAAHKGIDVLISSMRLVWQHFPDSRLLIAGADGGVDLGHLLGDLSERERERVRVWGEFADSDRRWLFAACDVVAHPSRSESFGMVMLEAWSAARPVVVADIDVTRSLVVEGLDGALVPVGDYRTLGTVLIDLLGSAGARERMGSAGRARAEREFAWSVIVDQWAELLESLSAGRRIEVC